MFDLFRSRQKSVRYLLGGLLTLVALSMVTYLIPGYGGTSRSSADDQVLADIGPKTLTTQEVMTMAKRVFQQGQVPPDMVDVYLPQMIDDMVHQRALEYEFQRLGLTISDDEVLTGMMSSYSQFFKDGALISKEQLEQALAQQGVTLQDAEDQMRTQLLLRKVENVVYASVIVTDKEVQDFFTNQKEKAKIQYIAFPPAKFRTDVKPTDDELRAQFNANKNSYVIPEKRTFQVLIVDQTKVEQSLVISDAQLRARYSASMDNFRTPERVKVRHILVMTKDKPDAEKKSLLKKAEDLLSQLKGGADFAELAKKNSDDKNSAQNGGDVGWVVHGQMVPEFEKAAFSLKPKELSGIVSTEFGYHILQVTEKQPASVKSFEEVKTDLAAQMKKDGVSEKMQSIADQVRAALQKSPGSAAEIAKQFNVDLVTVNKAAAGAPVPTLGISGEIDNAVSALKPNEVTPILTLPANRLVIAVLNERIPARQAEFSEVEGQVRERIVSDKATLIAAQRAMEAAVKLRAGEDIEKVAKSFNLEVNSPAEFTRNDSVEGLGSAVYLQDAFVKPIGTILGPMGDVSFGRNVVVRVAGRTPPDMTALVAERDTIRLNIRKQKVVERNNLFMDSVVSRLTAEGKVKIHQDTISKLIASLRQR